MDKIYAYQLDSDGVPQRCFIASNDAVIPNEYSFLHSEPLPVTCTVQGGEVIVPAVEVYTANDIISNDAWNWANDSGNDYTTIGNNA